MMKPIAISQPVFNGNEATYLMECIRDGWVSQGRMVERFERKVADMAGTQHAVACTSGTTALHLALLALGVGPGDEVIVPTLTYVATANAVRYCGATPVFVDVEPLTGCIDPLAVERALTRKTRAIMAVHLYGHPCEMHALTDITDPYSPYCLALISDAAEAHGAQYRNHPLGYWGAITTYSFYGNKIVTCGEGGAITTRFPELADRARFLAGQAQSEHRYWHTEVGYNYRLTDIQAAVGVAQMEMLEWHLRRRREVAAWYAEELAGWPLVRMQPELDGVRHARWMVAVQLSHRVSHRVSIGRDAVIDLMAEHGIETRPVFWPMHRLPMYRDGYDPTQFPVAERLSSRGLLLPTHAALSKEDVSRVCTALKAATAMEVAA